MKKKIMLYFVSSIIMVATIFAFLTVVIFQYKAKSNMISLLKDKDQYVFNLVRGHWNDDKKELLKTLSRDNQIRVTILDSQGELYYDNWREYKNFQVESHTDEIIEAMENGSGSSVREDFVQNGDVLCVAVKDEKSGYIVRSCINSSYVDVIDDDVFNYLMIIIIVIIIVALWISNKMTYIIVEPIKYLDGITTRFSLGDMSRRSALKTRDEIGSLSDKFNIMADSIEANMKRIMEANNKLESILNSMDSGVIAIDRAGRVIMINDYAKNMFGIKYEVLGKSIYTEVCHEDVIKIFSYGDEENEIIINHPSRCDIRIKRRDIMNKGDHLGVVAVLEDITEFKKLDEMRMQFVSNVSHELKTPLTSIMGFSQTLLDVKDEKTRRKFLNIIISEAERLTILINDTLTLSKLDSGSEVRNDKFIIDNILEEVMILLEIKCESANISISKKGKINYEFMGDKDKFKQMLINIIDNAIKYSNKGSNIDIICEEEESLFKITVKDEGIGINEEELKYIFQRFYRVDKARSRDSGGTGLGLAIVKHIIVLLGGKIDVKSIPGQGSEFTITMYKNRKKDKLLNIM